MAPTCELHHFPQAAPRRIGTGESYPASSGLPRCSTWRYHLLAAYSHGEMGAGSSSRRDATSSEILLRLGESFPASSGLARCSTWRNHLLAPTHTARWVRALPPGETLPPARSSCESPQQWQDNSVLPCTGSGTSLLGVEIGQEEIAAETHGRRKLIEKKQHTFEMEQKADCEQKWRREGLAKTFVPSRERECFSKYPASCFILKNCWQKFARVNGSRS
ncbi:hypothetical protein KSP40_PGU016835 [Platanthera guangdongensis]|uniref:Uncharacterized protein n=1 Tax=Platanthera guangdongensis TaxID=2320717 RepID=A0ABR2LZM1_9ASPA